ncbi:DUF1656 domain-containing protein [Aurantiacibacter xanthus]|uniref:DUF1656 domain-containing protein n=1 Tax=Aurantiacibacter xanthus TaxID=1784712 RepID=A0A3A1PDW3_9SPHN|nr:DUF1656 domain-containing protein [Aurantiacibacter xanthus]RIV91190.1 DUF1656 domain-containing protein [Aurantiacibacter xanthus]
MIPDIAIGGVLLPGLLVLAIVSLVLTVGILRLLATVGLAPRFGARPLLEIATFTLVYALLMQFLPFGNLS